MEKIFLIGDSISLYYHQYLKTLFDGIADYNRKGTEEEIKIALTDPNRPFGANGGDSNQVKKYMQNLAKEGKRFDILLVNCGLHDIRSNRATLEKQISEEEYARNLEDIVAMGKEIANKFIWITTTHVDDTIHNKRKEGSFRFNQDVKKYNEIANIIMEKHNIPIIDLYTFTNKLRSDDMYRDHVHFTDNISKLQAKFIYKELKDELV